MKSIVWGLVLLIAFVSSYAAFFPEPGIVFEFKGAECSNGTIWLNVTHEGNNIAYKNINLTVESDALPAQRLLGDWFISGSPAKNYDYPLNISTGNNFFSKMRFRFKTAVPMFTESRYIVTLNWKSNSIYYDRIKFAVNCPAKQCVNDNQCISQQACVNQTCQWLDCDQDKFAMGHSCLPKCNDEDECTNDYFIDGQCVFVKIDDCMTVEEKIEIEQKQSMNIFVAFWNWLKSRYE
jgi:hypothetical protein